MSWTWIVRSVGTWEETNLHQPIKKKENIFKNMDSYTGTNWTKKNMLQCHILSKLEQGHLYWMLVDYYHDCSFFTRLSAMLMSLLEITILCSWTWSLSSVSPPELCGWDTVRDLFMVTLGRRTCYGETMAFDAETYEV